MLQTLSSLTYSSVISCDSVRLAFLIAALNDIEILAADIGNAYLNAYTKEKVHTTCGVEFGQQYVGHILLLFTKLLIGYHYPLSLFYHLFYLVSLLNIHFVSPP